MKCFLKKYDKKNYDKIRFIHNYEVRLDVWGKKDYSKHNLL